MNSEHRNTRRLIVGALSFGVLSLGILGGAGVANAAPLPTTPHAVFKQPAQPPGPPGPGPGGGAGGPGGPGPGGPGGPGGRTTGTVDLAVLAPADLAGRTTGTAARVDPVDPTTGAVVARTVTDGTEITRGDLVVRRRPRYGTTRCLPGTAPRLPRSTTGDRRLIPCGTTATTSGDSGSWEYGFRCNST